MVSEQPRRVSDGTLVRRKPGPGAGRMGYCSADPEARSIEDVGRDMDFALLPSGQRLPALDQRVTGTLSRRRHCGRERRLKYVL